MNDLLNLSLFESIGDCLESSEDGSDDDVAIVCVGDEGLQCECGINGSTEGFVHLPVAGDYGFTHKSFFTGLQDSFISQSSDAGEFFAGEKF